MKFDKPWFDLKNYLSCHDAFNQKDLIEIKSRLIDKAKFSAKQTPQLIEKINRIKESIESFVHELSGKDLIDLEKWQTDTGKFAKALIWLKNNKWVYEKDGKYHFRNPEEEDIPGKRNTLQFPLAALALTMRNNHYLNDLELKISNRSLANRFSKFFNTPLSASAIQRVNKDIKVKNKYMPYFIAFPK